MFRSKRDVDRHVQEILRKITSEKERNLRCYNIAKLYYQVGDYESARRYISSYLTVREDSASGHKLFAQILEALGQKEKAVTEYKCSLELEHSQPDIILKVCDLLGESDLSIDLGRVRYWCERASQLYPHHPAVFRLKERLLSTKGEESLHELEALISSEMSARPSDVSLRIRLIKLYREADRLKDAYDHIVEVERRSLFRENLEWYECISVVLKAYAEKYSDICGWEFYLYYTSVQEKKAYLSLGENHAMLHKTVADCVQVLFSFDQLLTKASQQSPPPSERDYYHEFLRHMRGQLCLHLATLLLKRAKKDQTNWREMCRMAIPLLLHALGPPPDVSNIGTVKASESRRKIVHQWSKEAAFRISQAGHVLLAMLHERRSQFLDRITQYCSGNWRERVFQRIFNTRDHHQQIGTSHFVNFSAFADPPLEIPTASELSPHDELSQQLYPNSLHHLVWLGLQKMSASKSSTSSKLCKDFYCLVFDGLQLTTKNLNSAGIETLCRLDIDAFLYATVLCVAAAQEELLAVGYSNSDRPATLPACITDQLCTVAQDKWWIAAYTVIQKQVEGNLGELRQVLQHGIEVVRILGNHGLDVRLIVQLARAFAERATSMAARGECAADVTAIEQRAALYWTSALPLLERLQRNQTIRAPHTKLFEYHGKELSSAEINTLIEEGRFFLACQLMKEDKHERALEAFEQLKSPYAAFYRALIYKKLAEEQFQGQHREMITSEMRSQHIILLTKARECFYLTLDRLKSPGVDSKHPLNAELGGHIEEIESQLHHIDTDVSRSDVNRNDVLDGLSLETASSEHSPVDNGHMFIGYNGTVQNSFAHISSRNRSANRLSSTPYRSNNKCDTSDVQEIRRAEARPSPERLDAQIRQLLHNRDSVLQTVTQHSKAVMESVKVIMEELKDCKKEMKESKEELRGYNQELRHNKQMIEELKAQVQELRKETLKLKKGQSHVNSELSQVCDTEDDLYVFDEEDYAEDVTIAASHMGTYPPFQPFPGYPDYRPVSGIMGTPSVPYAPPPPPPPREAHPQLIPPTQAMGGFFRGVEPALIYPPGTVGYYSGQGALPFSEGQQLPDFRGHQAPAFSRLGTHPDPQNTQPEVKVSLTSAPVNVVITSSDTLPTTVPVTQPILSVTIPPQHRLGGMPLVQSDLGTSMPQAMVSTTYSASKPLPLTTTQTSFSSTSHLQQQLPPSQGAVSNIGRHTVPHAFQITMPPQAHLPQVSSLEKGAASLSPVLPIATNSLLSSVPSPVYSAVVTEKNLVPKEISPKSRQASMGSNAEEENVAETDHDPCPDFEPVIPLPAEVQVMTGEEEETVLFESRAKLYRFVEKEWKERGIGNIKLLHNQKTGKIRILMRREQVLKVCANHFITADTELVPMKDIAWIWVANDFADEQVKLEKLCVRFKTPEEATSFKDAFEKAKSIIRLAQTSIEDESTVSSRSGSSTKTVDSVASSQDSSSSVLRKEISSQTSVTPSSTAPVSVCVTSNKITVGGFTFASTPTFKDNTTPEGKTVDNDSSKTKVPQDDASKVSPFATFSFAMPSKPVSFPEVSKPVAVVMDPFKTTSTPDTSTCITVATQSQASKPGTTVSESSRIAVSKPEVSNYPTQSHQIGTSQEVTQFGSQRNMTAVETEKAGNEPLMFSSNSLTFADLAAKSPAGKPAFAADSNFKGFEGAGSVVFGSTQVSQKSKPQITQSSPDSLSERPPEDFVPTAEFKPVIPLPELVEVRTGEEDEEIIFEERCKLLRFDGENKEWKERGIGKMKLLHDPKSGRVRLLMRREQVLKVCCNHAITTAIKFKPLSTSDRAWYWAAQDYSEGEMRRELLAIKFKTTDLAEKFKKAVEDTQAKMINDRIPLDGSNKEELSAEGNDEKQLKEKLRTGEGTNTASNLWECPSCHKNNPSDSSSCHSCNSNKIQKTSAEDSSPKSLSEFKPKAGSWECKSCYTRNEGTCRTCVACEAVRIPTTTVSTSSTTSDQVSKLISQNIVPLSEAFKPKPGSWTCSDCYLTNEERNNRCVACDKLRLGSDGKPINESTAEDKTAFKFGIQSSNTESSSGFNLSRFLPTCDVMTSVTTTTTTGMSTTTNASSCVFSFGFPKLNTQNKDGAASFSFGSSTESQNTLDPVGTSLKYDLAVERDTLPKQSLSFGFQVPTSSVDTPQVKQLPETKNTPTFIFGNSLPATKPTGAAVTFGADKTPIKENNLVQVRSEHSFTFGSPGKFEFSFSGVRPKSPIKSPKSPGTKHSVSVGEEESGSEEEEEEYEGDNIYFQPVIPLPDKVPVHTGEEEEDLLYSQHAKLYRFVSGEWKERGLGDIKILRHRVTKKIRLLMRRDQVLKVCLNHFLTPEITFIEKDAKSWLWSAPDFSDGHIENERFAIRFKTPDIAAEFKKAIDQSQAGVAEGKIFSSEKGSNRSPGMADKQLSLETKGDGSGDATSPAFKTFSFAVTDNKPESSGTPKFSLSSRFGLPEMKGAVQPLFGGVSKASHEKVDDSPEVIYELAVTEQEKAEAERLMLPSNFYAYRRKPGCPGCPGCKDDEASESDGERGAESSNVDTSAHKPNCSGDFSLAALGQKTAGTVDDNTEDKNKQITSNATPIKPKMGSGILQPPTFSFNPTFGQSTTTTNPSWFSRNTAAVFTSPAMAAGDAKNITIDQTGSLDAENKFGVASLVATNTVAEKAAISTPEFGKTPGRSSESEKQISNLATGTSLFGSQGQKVESCSNAPLFTLFPPSSQAKSVQDQPLMFNFGPTSKFGCEPKVSKTPGFGFTAPFQTESILRSSATESTDLKTMMEPSHSILQPDEKHRTVGKQLEENLKPEGLFSSVQLTITFADLASKIKPQEQQPGTESTFRWEGAGSTVFGGLKKQTPQRLEASYQQKSVSPDSAAEEEASDEETAAASSSVHDPHFEPVIPLPDAIIVHTGEEEEVVKFASRATLFRFDEALKQWKERGVGDMKILYHPINHTYRLLLRREKIHKVVCNHLITADFSLKPFSKSERAWLWAAHNFADNEGELEKLAVSFKKEETAKEFYDKVTECVEDVKTFIRREITSSSTTDRQYEDSEESIDDDDDDDDDEEDDDDDDDDDGDDDGDDGDDDDDDDDDEGEDDADDDDDDSVHNYSIKDANAEESTVFDKRATLTIKDGNQWKTLGLGDLKIQYNKAKQIAQIIMLKDGSTETLCNMIISKQINVEVKKRDCEWTGIDSCIEPGICKTLCAKFSSDTAAHEFANKVSQYREVEKSEHE
ncbi:E3 SUMO-protein ligase RanBP2 [Schistocerca piceifrons]|uniref:E3 SUMO-protein ligase RanBP2 n=1 Tax=Schistocerca piceifrons TaxID=274613 RepID=UPI001F5E912B|nr:E3 SUMO-protein ligase RanBP2 [Schistocerca piceifrons]